MSLFKKRKFDDHEEAEKKSDKIYAWSHLIRSFSKFLWVLVFIIVLAALGKIYIGNKSKDTRRDKVIQKTVVEKIDWEKINSEIAIVISEARKEAEILAIKKLDLWIQKNMHRVDQDFLDWYFSYWTQQKLGLKGLLAQVWHWVDSDSPTAAENITEEVQGEFSIRVIRPQIAQLEIERIIHAVIQRYSMVLREKLDKIPKNYQIRETDWDRHITDIATMVTQTEGNRNVSLSLKAMVGATAGGTVFLVKTLKPLIIKISGKISTKLAAKQAAKMATKTGGKVAATSGGKFAGAIIAIGIIIWDVWDHFQTVKKAKPVLRQNIADYFTEMKQSILHDPESGIFTTLYQIEKGLLAQLK